MTAALSELRDYRGILLAGATGLAVLAVEANWASAVGAAMAVLLVKVSIGTLIPALEKQRRLPDLPLPGLSQHEAQVAFGIWRGLSDDEIAAQLRTTSSWVAQRVRRVMDKWDAPTRGAVRQRVEDEVGPPPRLHERWEWIAELGLGVSVAGIGLTILFAPLPFRDVIGSGLIALGLLGCLFSTVNHFRG